MSTIASPLSRASTLALIALLPLACVPTSDETSAVDEAAAPEVLDLVGATVTSPDGQPIVFDARGQGETALVFIHCWSCNRGFWREQIDVFTDEYRVVALDLGGHGESGRGRDPWTITGLGPDVKAVADDLGLERMVLIGHSMGGPVALEAARLMPDRVLGVVAVDTLQNADFEFPEAMAAQMIAAFEADFEGAMAGMFEGMAATGMSEELRSWIVAEAVAADPEVAIALMKDFSNLDMPAMFSAAGVPIRAVNAVPTGMSIPTDIEANRKYADYDAVIMDGVGHFLHLERPEEFNGHLRAFLYELTAE